MKRLSLRERILLVVALTATTAVAYGVLRLRPVLAELEQTRQVTEATVARRDGLTWPQAAGDASALERELEELQAVIREAKATLGGMEHRFVSLANPDAREDLRLEVSASASRCRVRFRENVECAPATVREFVSASGTPPDAESKAARLVRFLALGEPYALPVREVAFDASFCGLCTLLRGLADLSSEVVVLRFEIDVQADDARGPTPLSSRLLLVY